MQLLKQTIETILISIKKLLFTIKTPPKNRRILLKQIPYFSQWESPELGASLQDKLHDPNWKKSGASTKEEYLVWSWSGCGMACLKMILADRLGKIYPLVTLGKKCMEYGGYIDHSDQYDLKKLIAENVQIPPGYFEGLFYTPFLHFIRQEFNLKGRIVRLMIIPEIVQALSEKAAVIVSVNSDIRDSHSHPQKKGGHLVLMTGYDLDKQLLYLHNPSGVYQKSQEHYPITFDDFEKFFAHRGVIIS